MNPKLLGTVLKEELKKTSTAGSQGEASPIKEEEFERNYAIWMLRQKLAENAYLLTADHVTDAEAFLQALRKQDGNERRKSLLDRLHAPLTALIRSGKPNKCSIDALIPALNELLKGASGLFSAEELENGDDLHKALLKECKLPPVAVNRLQLQGMFGDLIVRVWDTVPVALVHRWIHAHPEVEHNAICLSGGGIRSATFGLGILQGLAKHGILPRFQYLSTVSGGGYIGSWLSAWISREGFEKVTAALGAKNSVLPTIGKDPLNPEPEEVRHLREYSNYLTPKLGLASADTWTLVGAYLRNLFLNWCVFLPALMAVLMVPRLSVAICQYHAPNWLGYTTFGFGVIGILWALVYAALHRPGMGLDCAAKSGQMRFLGFCFLPLYLSSICFTSIWAWLQQNNNFLSLVFANVQATNKPLEVWPFLALAVGIHGVACVIYSVRLKNKGLRESLACLLSGCLGGLLLWAGAGLAHKSFDFHPSTELFVCFGAPWFLASFLFSLFLFVGLTSRFTTDEDREWWARMSAWSLIAIGAWCLFSVLVLFGPEGLLKLPTLLSAAGGITGIITLVLSHSGDTPANQKEAISKPGKPAGSNIVLALAAPVFIACFVAALSLGTTWLIKTVDSWHKLSTGMGNADHQEAFYTGTRLSEDDITDFPSFASRLVAHADADSTNVWENLSPSLQQQMTQYVGTDSRMKGARARLVRELNSIIANNAKNDDFVLEPNVSSETQLQKDQTADWAQNLDMERKMQLNRFRLQEAFPMELRQSYFDHGMITHLSSFRLLIAIFFGFLAITFGLSLLVNINRFSLHAIYRNRIIRAYLGASNRNRRPNPFTGFDPLDNLSMRDLKCKPFHIVNMTLNLVSGGENLAWQQRKAESFTASPLHAGSERLGYRLVEEYAAGRPRKKAALGPEEKDYGLKLGTAVTISGAAASPNMGYHSSPVLAFVMTLFNIRLGAWLGNPGIAGDKSYRDKAPKLAFLQVVREALGMTDDKERYVYLSDGGHFENLGLYEMVSRRCRNIVVSDAGCDPNCALTDLGNAIRKIRIDFGIPIEIDKFSIASRKNTESKYCAIGKIMYSEVDGDGAEDGNLIYIKPAIGGDEPKDVFNYKEISLLFPHESTGDQWFSESQFESYRVLSAHMVDTMSRGASGIWKVERGVNPLKHFYNQTEAYLKGKPGQFTKKVTGLSPSFCSYYNEGLNAEARKGWDESGVHYRKSVEFLFKDFVIFTNSKPDGPAEVTIRNSELRNLVEQFVDDPRIKTCIQRSPWLFSAEPAQKWNEKDADEARRLIGIITNYIDTTMEAESYSP